MLHKIQTDPILFLKTYDRNSGELTINAICYKTFGEGYIVAASHEANACKPDWYLNLKAEPLVEIEVEGMERFAVASTPVGADRLEILPLVEALSAGVDKLLPRNITGVLLKPMD
jgi:deazaflavin-dependent oxidoreductase (nitroreductase family)